MKINLKLIKTTKKHEGALSVVKFLWAKLISQFLFQIPSLKLNNIHNILCKCANRVMKAQFKILQKHLILILSNFGLGLKSPSFGN